MNRYSVRFEVQYRRLAREVSPGVFDEPGFINKGIGIYSVIAPSFDSATEYVYQVLADKAVKAATKNSCGSYAAIKVTLLSLNLKDTDVQVAT